MEARQRIAAEIEWVLNGFASHESSRGLLFRAGCTLFALKWIFINENVYLVYENQSDLHESPSVWMGLLFNGFSKCSNHGANDRKFDAHNPSSQN